jgi:glutamine synthetase
MTLPKGRLDLPALTTAVEDGSIDTIVAAFPDHYGRLHGKRIDALHFVSEVAEQGTHACDYLLTVDMEMEPVTGYRYANWERGYGDFHMVPDLDTLRVAAWLDRTAIVLCDLHDPQDHAPVAVAPRSILRRQLERAAALGLEVVAASELEYYLFEDSYRESFELGYRDLTPAGWYLEDYHLLQGTRQEHYHGAVRRALNASGIPVESSKGEFGRGQHEMNVRYAPLLEMADRHVVMKLAMKEIAELAGVSVTFMAKPDAAEAGSSSHLHLSVWRDGVNAFAGDDEFGPIRGSETFRRFLGGWLEHAADLTALMAPTVNSYKRYVDGSWAPTRIAWSHDNRTAGFRVVGSGPSLRIECRIPGADVNPYLAYAGALAAGLDGIARGTEPPPMFSGDVYQAAELPRIPHDLGEAAERFAASSFVAESLGTDVQEHYAHFLRTERAAFDAAVTDWERARYFERI